VRSEEGLLERIYGMPPFVAMIKVEERKTHAPYQPGASAWKPFCRSAPGMCGSQ